MPRQRSDHDAFEPGPRSPAEDWSVVANRATRVQEARRTWDPGLFISETTALMDHAQPRAIAPQAIAALLDAAGIEHALIGAHAVAVHARVGRATRDVDLIVSDVEAAAQAILVARPDLRAVRLGGGIGVALIDAHGDELVDLLAARFHGRAAALRDATPMLVDGQRVRVPSVEMVIALKYIALRSLGRDGAPGRPATKRHYDIADLTAMMLTNPDFDARRVGDALASAYDADFAARWHREWPAAAAGKGFPLE